MYQPKFIITNKILQNIGTIEVAREVIRQAPLLPFYEKKFQTDALVRSVHFGTHIEGNELNLSQAEKVVMGQNITARARDIQEVINYRNVMEFIGEWGDKNEEVSLDLILKLHKMVVEKILPFETSGMLRKTAVAIRNSYTHDVIFKPPEFSLVPKQLDDLIEFIQKTTLDDFNPVIKSGSVHFEFVRIHPFVDGNGRVARALSTLILFDEGYDIRRFFSLEEYFDKDPGAYYSALQSVDGNNGDLTDWIEYFTKGLAIELSKIKEKVENVSIDQKLKKKLGGKPLMLTDRQLKIIEYIQAVGFLQNQAFKELFPMVSEDSILLDLKVLLKYGIVKKQGITKGARYIMK